MPLQSAVVADAQRRIQRVAHSQPGAREHATYFVGQVVGPMNEAESTRRVVADMVEELVSTMERLGRLVDNQ